MLRFVVLTAALGLGACASAPQPGNSEISSAPQDLRTARAGYAEPRGVRAPVPARMPAAAAPAESPAAIDSARRLYTVADAVVLRGAALCEGRQKPHTGMRIWSNPAHAARGRVRPVSVFSIVPGGPAAAAGLQPDDLIVSIAGERIASVPQAVHAYAERIDAAMARGGPIDIGYRRGRRDGVARIEPRPGCDIRVIFANSHVINAATDGRSVMVMRGLVEFLRRDDELALVVGHELAHNVLGHFARGRALYHGAFADRGASLRSFEREADYVGLYFVALAGYDTAAAIESSRRMEALNPFGDAGSASHPSQAERYAALRRALREIEEKRRAGAPLHPNLPVGTAAASAPPGRQM